MATMKCPNCKTPIEVTPDLKSVVCPGCGKKYRNPKYVAPTPQAEPTPVQETKPQVPTLDCPNCKTPIVVTPDLDIVTCTGCGKQYKNPNYVAPAQAPAAVPVPTYAPDPAPAPAPTTTQTPTATETSEAAPANGSKFTGTMLSWLGHHIVNFLLTIITLGLAYPWVVCRQYRWKIDHQVIDGHKLKFEGKGGSLFGRWLGWVLLTIITIGIFGLWVPCKVQKWITENTHIDETYVAQ